ncbi:MAG TPA: diheme cytochrome c [Gallionellaceae bacterium]
MIMQKKTKFIALLSAALLLTASTAIAEEDFWDWIGHGTVQGWRGVGVKPVDNKQYKEECGSCHFAYQPGLLPEKSWEKLLTAAGLHDHFGEVADLDKETLQAIREYVLANSAEKSYYKIARKITIATEDGPAPLRITEVRYIKRKHNDIPAKMVKDNKDVKSLSYCNACHTKAEKGIFKEDTVSIPNYPDY